MNHVFPSVGRTQTLSHTVAKSIEAAIREGRLAVGEKLPSEMELCRQFNVSRTVMREALRMLAARNLVRIEKGRGIFVNAPTVASVAAPMALYLHMQVGPDYALDLVRTRQLIEPPIAAEAARKRTDEDIARIRINLEELRCCQSPFEKLSQLDLEFHVLIAKATHNPVVPLIIQPIQALMPKVKTGVYQKVHDAHASAVEWHTAIAEAIFDRDPERAEAHMRTHLRFAEEHIRRMMAASAER